MAAAIDAARPYAVEVSQTTPTTLTAFSVDLVEACGDICSSPVPSGSGWGVVFEMTDPDGLPSRAFVVLDAANQLVFVQQ